MASESDADDRLYLLINDDTPPPTWRLQGLASPNGLLHFAGSLQAYTDVIPDYIDDIVLFDDEATWEMPEGWAWQHDMSMMALERGYRVEITVTFTITLDKLVLKCIKGAGGSFGVIVELTIRTYPLKHLLSGQLVFDGTDVDATVRGVFHGIQRLRDQHAPGALCVAPLFLNTPHGRATFCHVMWADEDVETGAKWVEEVSRFAKLERNGVRQTTHGGATEDFGADSAPDGAYGSVDTMSIRAFTDEVVDVIARNVRSMPAQFGTGLAVHVVMRPSSDFLDQSVFDAQEPHYMFEFLHTTTSEERVEETDEWAKKFLAEMQQTDPSNILPSTYISLTPPGGNTLKRIYGANYDFVMSLKKKYDPEGVFKLAVPFSYLE